MLCKICNNHMYIIKGKHRVENDNTPDVPTKLFYDHTYQCTNDKCKHTEIVSNEIELGE